MENTRQKTQLVLCYRCGLEYDPQLMDCPYCIETNLLLNKDYTLGRCIK